MLVDLRPRDAELTGADAERWLESAGIVGIKNGIPNDPRKPMVTSGLRLGTPALTTRGMKEDDMRRVAGLIDRVLDSSGDEDVCAAVREEVRGACELLGFDPLYVACEGRFLAVVPGEETEAALAAVRSTDEGKGARLIGRVVADDPGRLVMKTRIGSHRLLERLSGEQLPRIC